jgi:DNA-directed RNA polymerase subunit RPC12/RpoP
MQDQPPPPTPARERRAAAPWGRPASGAPPPAPPRPPATAALETHRFPCPACGADLRYAPGTTLMRCQHCGTEEPIPDIRGEIAVLDLREAARLPEAAMEETRTVACASCGAEVEFDADLHARECPFCASPVVTDTGTHRHIKPQAQLPILVTEAEARDAFRRWIRSLWFAPNDLRKLARADGAMQGVYAPYWTYDAETETAYTGQRGRVRHTTRRVPVTVNGKRQMQSRTVEEIDWTPVRGRVSRDFRDVLVLGSRSLPKRFTDSIAPWDLVALSTYDPRFIAGFRAEGYTVPVDEGYQEARQIMNAVIETDVRRDIGGDRQRVGRLETRVGRLGFKHVLLPLWMAAYRYRGRSFRFVVNGRTGAVCGERPWSVAKIALAVLALVLAGFLLAVLQFGV